MLSLQPAPSYSAYSRFHDTVDHSLVLFAVIPHHFQQRLQMELMPLLSLGRACPLYIFIGNRSPPKEEDDMRAAEVLQGLKGVGGPTG